MDPVTSQHGFDLAAIRETELHGEAPYPAAWDKRRNGLKAMHAKVNELVDEVNALKAKLAEGGGRPF